MNGKIRKYLPLLGIVAVLVLWGLWYSRPVGVGTLFPDFDPDSVEVIVTDYAVGDRTASYSKGTPEYDAVLAARCGIPSGRSCQIRASVSTRANPTVKESISILPRMTGRRTTRPMCCSSSSMSGSTAPPAATESGFTWE